MNISRRNLVLKGLATISRATFYKVTDTTRGAETLDVKEKKTFFKLYPVGEVKKQSGFIKLRIFSRYHNALKGLDGFSHVLVFYWFDRNDTPKKRNILQVHPRGNKKKSPNGCFCVPRSSKA
jgi:tRNA (Thr-GGU) A37 N-methylase